MSTFSMDSHSQVTRDTYFGGKRQNTNSKFGGKRQNPVPSRLQREGLSISICDALKREDIYTIGIL